LALVVKVAIVFVKAASFVVKVGNTTVKTSFLASKVA
jgi:hypothetical protein